MFLGYIPGLNGSVTPRMQTLRESVHGNPWVVEVVLSALNQQDFEVPVEGGQSTRNDTAAGASYRHH